MTSQPFHWSLLSVFFFSVFVGCSSKQPTGFPEVYPCSIRILKDGAPLDKVNIMLDASEPTFHNIGYSGETDSQGKAIISTNYPNYNTKGVPAGEYRVLLKKRDVIEGEKSREEVNRMGGEELEVYTAELEKKRRVHKPTIPPHFWEFETSPLTFTMAKDGADLTFDIKDYPQK